MSVWFVELGINGYEREKESEDFIKEIYENAFHFYRCFRNKEETLKKSRIRNFWHDVEDELIGCPDLVAFDKMAHDYGSMYYCRLIEIKGKNGGLRRPQVEWIANFKDKYDIDVLYLNGDDLSVKLLGFWEGENMDPAKKHMNENSWDDKKHLLKAYMDGERGTDLYYPR